MDPSLLPVPKRGIRNTYSSGVTLGGAPLDSDYSLVALPGRLVTSSAGQVRTDKRRFALEETFSKARKDPSTITFSGRIDLPDTDSAKELDKEKFVKEVADHVRRYGMQNLFAMPHPTDTSVMTDLTESYHLVTVEQVIAEYEVRILPEPSPVLDQQGVETPDSISVRHRHYDSYERDDVILSRLMLESLVSPTFREVIENRYSHIPGFDSLPGQIYFRMALEACNSSIFTDIRAAEEEFRTLKLINIPGHCVTTFTGQASKLLKTLQNRYSLPVDLGSCLLLNALGTESQVFNSAVSSWYLKVQLFESKYTTLNPRSIQGDPEYIQLGPFAIIAWINGIYGQLVTQKNWPALTTSIPQAHTAAVLPSSSSTSSHSGGGSSHSRGCFNCGSPTHFKRDCPKPSKRYAAAP